MFWKNKSLTSHETINAIWFVFFQLKGISYLEMCFTALAGDLCWRLGKVYRGLKQYNVCIIQSTIYKGYKNMIKMEDEL